MSNPKYLFLLAIIIPFLSGCHEGSKPPAAATVEPPHAFIHPPLPGADVPFKTYSVTAEKGDTLFYPSGSILLFPPGAFVDKAGNSISGNVTVKYREFADPLDYFLAGIPMSYDSAHTAYNFVSSGMCEIRAFKNDIPVFVNPAAQPEIFLAATGDPSGSNLYFLDTAQRKWMNKGGFTVVDPQHPATLKKTSILVAAKNDTPLVAPVMPAKASGQKPQIVINVAPGSFAELMAYNNLKFELQDADKSWNPKDADEEWSDIQLEHTATKGLYTIRFSNARKKVVYSARPVLEGKDYEAAVKIFEIKRAEYEKALARRLKKEALDSAILEAAEIKILAENERVKKINMLIEARNRAVEERNKQILAENKRIEGMNRQVSILNSFSANGFGIWNCDMAIKLNTVELTAHFTDSTGKEINLASLAVVYKSKNTVFQFDNNIIRILPDADNMIWGVTEGRFAYVSYDVYRKLHITADTKEQTFPMTILPADKSNYETIRALVGKL